MTLESRDEHARPILEELFQTNVEADELLNQWVLYGKENYIAYCKLCKAEREHFFIGVQKGYGEIPFLLYYNCNPCESTKAINLMNPEQKRLVLPENRE